MSSRRWSSRGLGLGGRSTLGRSSRSRCRGFRGGGRHSSCRGVERLFLEERLLDKLAVLGGEGSEGAGDGGVVHGRR